jgi:DeoR/GlpR family transcriptional regulator of sugar metabolism
MFAEERKKAILHLLTETGRVEVAALAARFEVSEDSIRRDLRELAAAGFLQKTYGGAVALDVANLSWAARKQIHSAAKALIGAAAAALVEPDQTIILDAGQTTLELAKQLRARPVHVITNSLDVANTLAEQSQVRLVLLGGEWNATDRCFTGELGSRGLASYRADWTFLGAYGVHEQAGVTEEDAPDAAMKRAMIASGMRSVLLADHSKFGRLAKHFVSSIDGMHALVTDEPPAWLPERARVVVARSRTADSTE